MHPFASSLFSCHLLHNLPSSITISQDPTKHISIRAALLSNSPRRSEPPSCTCAVPLSCYGLLVFGGGYLSKFKREKMRNPSLCLGLPFRLFYVPLTRPGHRACLQISSALGQGRKGGAAQGGMRAAQSSQKPVFSSFFQRVDSLVS